MANPNTTEEPKQPLQKPGEYVPTPYAPPTPTATYENNPIYDEIQRQINEWATKTDPQAQAEQDARIQRGRNFWTGANLFANVIANAINAGGTAKGAPSMTFNDAATQRMYTDWQTADRELKADRKAAQQRLDALRLQDAQFRMADKQAADKAALDAYNRNYEAGERANQINYGTQVKEYERGIAEQQRQQQRQEGMEDYEQKLKLQNKYRPKTGGGGSTKTPDEEKYYFPVGGTTIKAKNSWEQKQALRKISKELEKIVNRDAKNAIGQPAKPGDDAYIGVPKNGEYDYIVDYFDDIYASDEEFRKWFDRTYGDKDAGIDDRKRTTAPPQTSLNPSQSGFGRLAGQAQNNNPNRIPTGNVR